MRTVFFDPAWSEFIAKKWSLSTQTIETGIDDPSGMRSQITVFLNDRGRIRMPRLAPYLPVHFSSTPTSSPSRIAGQWLEASTLLARMMDDIGYGGSISFAPETRDLRAWQWLGHSVEVRYTYYLDFPYNPASASGAVRRNIKKATNAGYTCEMTEDVHEVHRCLSETEQRQGFGYGISEEDLLSLWSSLGADSCRFYVVRSPSRDVAAARVILHHQEGRAVDWISGTVTEHLSSGATQQLVHFALEDLQSIGAHGFDFEGANIPSVARSKMEWGAALVPFYTLRPTSVRTLAQDARRWVGSALAGLKGQP